MASYSTIWSVDIGNWAIKAVKMDNRKGTPTIIDYDVIPIDYSEDPGARTELIDKALAALVGRHDFGKIPVFLSIAGNLCFFKDFILPPGVGDHQLKDLVLLEAKQQIPMSLDDIYWGYIDFKKEEEIGVQLVAVRREVINELLATTDRHKLNVRGIGVAPISLYNLINYEYTLDGPTVVLDSGSKGTDFVVMSERKLFFRNIPGAGDEFTKVIAETIGKDFQTAEKTKRNIDKSKQKDKLLKALFPSVRGLSSHVSRSIGFYARNNQGLKISKTYLVGNTFGLPTLAENVFKQIKDGEKIVISSLKKIEIGAVNKPDLFIKEIPSMAISLGLALQGLGIGELDINLVPAERVEAEKRGHQQLHLAISVAVLFFASLMSFIVNSGDLDAVLAESANLAKLKADIEKNRADYRAVRDIGTDDDPDIPKTSLEIQKSFPKRLQRIGSDAGRVAALYETILKLEKVSGPITVRNPQSGEDMIVQKYLTEAYISRIPPTFSDAKGGPITTVSDMPRRGFENDIKQRKYYMQLAREKGRREFVPPELQSDLPLFCVLTFDLLDVENAVSNRVRREIKDQLVESGLVADPETGMQVIRNLAFKAADRTVDVRVEDTMVERLIATKNFPGKTDYQDWPEILGRRGDLAKQTTRASDRAKFSGKRDRFSILFRIYEEPDMAQEPPVALPEFLNNSGLEVRIWDELYKAAMTAKAAGDESVYLTLKAQYNRFFGPDAISKYGFPKARTIDQNIAEGWLDFNEGNKN